jgi:hypothetical protein
MILPEKFLKRMSKADREKLPGASGMTAAECEAAQIARSEAALQSQIVAMLERDGIYVVKQPTNKRSQLRIGTPDLLFAVKGRPVAWEVKMPGNKPRLEQVKSMAEMTANGWLCDVIFSYDEALNLFRQLNK